MMICDCPWATAVLAFQLSVIPRALGFDMYGIPGAHCTSISLIGTRTYICFMISSAFVTFVTFQITSDHPCADAVIFVISIPLLILFAS